MQSMPQRFVSLLDPAHLPADLAQPVLAIGNFDGVHVGHQTLIAEAVRLAKQLDTSPAVLTFEPHARLFFKPDQPMFRLTPPDLKVEAIDHAGAQGVITLSFHAPLANMSADEFVDRLLVERFAAKGVVIGENFRFGKGKSGTPAFLSAKGSERNFAVSVVQAVISDDGAISSTRIRQALAEGKVDLANRLLGREWRVRAVVAHGDKRGRLLGYPTANLILPIGTDLKYGIYAVWAVVDGRRHAAVASFGSRPTFDNGAPRLEVHLFDFTGDLYGQTMDVAFVGYIRPELRFDGVEPLIRQMDADSLLARTMLKNG
jgi:riboflavin kinase / FMN adenylyltransferase